LRHKYCPRPKRDKDDLLRARFDPGLIENCIALPGSDHLYNVDQLEAGL
jgi:hypothetical protein